jgi:hypothetical protein
MNKQKEPLDNDAEELLVKLFAEIKYLVGDMGLDSEMYIQKRRDRIIVGLKQHAIQAGAENGKKK